MKRLLGYSSSMMTSLELCRDPNDDDVGAEGHVNAIPALHDRPIIQNGCGMILRRRSLMLIEKVVFNIVLSIW